MNIMIQSCLEGVFSRTHQSDSRFQITDLRLNQEVSCFHHRLCFVGPVGLSSLKFLVCTCCGAGGRWSELNNRITEIHVKGIVTITDLPPHVEINYSRNLACTYNMNSEGSIDMVGDLPPTVIVHDMSFDWTGRRLAAACSDKTIRMFAKRGDKWSEENSIKIQGASAWKVKWARPEFGTIIATCSLDTQIRIYELKKIERGQGERNEWVSIHNIQENKAVQDIKFIPSKSNGLCLAIASSDGYLKVLMAEDQLKLKEWGSQFTLPVNQLGLSCLSWSKNLVKDEEALIAVGCKNMETSPRKVLNGMKIFVNGMEEEEEKSENLSTVAFVNFNRNANKPLEKIYVPRIRQTKSINDISWALMNGRSYYLLAVASDAFVKVFELNIRDSPNSAPVIDVLREMQLSNLPCMRISWNVMGTYLSGSEKKRIRLWRCLSRGVWNEVKEIEA